MRDSQFVKVAKALADPTRLRMLQEIRVQQELTCSQVCERFDLSQPTISHHIKTLIEAGLLTCRKMGQFHVLAVDEQVLAGFAAELVGTPGAAAGTRRARKTGGKSEHAAR